MSVQVWTRNPHNYVRECIELRHAWFAWDRGVLTKLSIDPKKWAELYVPADMDYRMLLVGDQGTAEITRDTDKKNPAGVYPTWWYGDDPIELLEEIVAKPVGENPAVCGDTRYPADERPVLGQEHRVVVTGLPMVSSGPGRRMMKQLADLQETYPDCIIHVHGLYSWRVMFGLGYRSVDIDPRTTAQKGKVMLPNGKEVTYEMTKKTPQWVTLLGYKPKELEVPRNRCMYNIKSAKWAAKHYMENVKFKSQGQHVPDTTSPDSSHAIATTDSTKSLPIAATDGDKILCDLCSLQTTCKYYRRGAVCSIPESEPAPLAKMFKTRDSERIIEGLGTLLAAQSRRLETGMEDEQLTGELDSEVTKIINSLFDRGVKLAKLVNPALDGGPKVGVWVNGGQGAQVAVGSSAKQLTANIVAQLEEQGIERENITPEMIQGVLERTNDDRGPRVIEAAAKELTDGEDS